MNRDPCASVTEPATRRQVLTAVGAVQAAVLTGCSLRVGQPVASRPNVPTVDDVARERAATLADELARWALAAARTRPALTDRLRTLAADHAAHAAALRIPADTSGRSSTTPSATPSTGTTSGSATLGSLAAAERTAAAALDDDLPHTSPDTARLLASIRASRLMHADRLTEWGREVAG